MDMRRKSAAKLLIMVVIVGLLSACASGPKQLTRSWDDYVNQKYTESAWVHGALLQDVLPLYGIVYFFAGFGDLFVNAYYFWSQDAWDNRGTGFQHEAVSGAKKTVKSP
jgi:hypothetical protein